MPSVAEALQNAADALNNAVTNVLNLRSQIEARLASITTTATTIVNNFASRPPIKTVTVDPYNGNDNNSGDGYTNALKSLDAAFSMLSSDYILQVYLFGDDTIRKRHTTSGKLVIFGVAVGSGLFGSIYVAASRKISFLAESIGGSVPSYGRVPAGMFVYAGDIRSASIDWEVANVPPGVDYDSHISTLGNTNFTILGGTITAAGAGGRGYLIDPQGSQITLTLSGAVGTNAPGRIIKGVAAGANPNSIWTARSNLQSA